MSFVSFSWTACFEVLIFSSLFYYSYLFLKGSRAYQILKGIVLIFFIFALAKSLGFTKITFILGKVFGVAAIVVVVLFQAEIRRAFAAIGRTHFRHDLEDKEDLPSILCEAISILAEKQVGALIAISREDSLSPYIDTGLKIDARVIRELMVSIFNPKSPLHDGGVILDGNRIMSASCLLPLSQKSTLSHALGTRHRAAIGLSEETDAFVITVSEETGYISFCSQGKLHENVALSNLKNSLKKIYHSEKPLPPPIAFKTFFQKVFFSKKTGTQKKHEK